MKHQFFLSKFHNLCINQILFSFHYRESDTTNYPVIALEECVTQNVDQSLHLCKEGEVVYDEVFFFDHRQQQSSDLIHMKASIAYASSQVTAGQQPASDQIHMQECPAYAPSQFSVIDQIPMEECPAYARSPFNDQTPMKMCPSACVSTEFTVDDQNAIFTEGSGAK